MTKLKQTAARYTGLVDKYRDRLPIPQDARAISLGEGDTPLVRLENIPRALDADVDVYVKYEGLNPTSSFKDRGMTVAVTKAVADGSRAVICASTGNTSASAAAYAARAGITAFVLIPEGKIALGKLAQAMMHGALVIQIKGNFDRGMQLVKQLADDAPVTLVNSVNPYRLQGQKTAAFEIIESLGRPPDYHCLPVGNAGNITAHWIGYSENAGLNTAACAFCAGDCAFLPPSGGGQRPRMLGYQASGAAPFIHGAPVTDPETVATAIRIGNPQSWDLAQAAQRESNGWFRDFTDAEILRVHRALAAEEGLFCEPASAISVAGALDDATHGRIEPGSVVVCTVTGHGLKDPDTALVQTQGEVLSVAAELDAVRTAVLANLQVTL